MEKLLLQIHAGISIDFGTEIDFVWSLLLRIMFVFVQDVLTQRYTTLLNLRKKFIDEYSHIRQDDEQQTRIYSASSTNQSKPTVAQASATFMA